MERADRWTPLRGSEASDGTSAVATPDWDARPCAESPIEPATVQDKRGLSRFMDRLLLRLAGIEPTAKPKRDMKVLSKKLDAMTRERAETVGSTDPTMINEISFTAEEDGDEYQVVWDKGPLGLTIDTTQRAVGAFIKQIREDGEAAYLSGDCIGDDLIRVNGVDVTRAPFKDIIAFVKSSSRPTRLEFRHRHTSRSADIGREVGDGGHYYTVVWQHYEPLGLTFRGPDETSEFPYISRVKGVGSSARLPQSAENDRLVLVNGQSVHRDEKTFGEVMAMLKTTKKPLTLTFRARGIVTLPLNRETTIEMSPLGGRSPTWTIIDQVVIR